MKEKNFRFTESFSKAVVELSDKQVGELTKGICNYVFRGKLFESKDTTLKATFALIKRELDRQKECSENGYKGAMARILKRNKLKELGIDAVFKGLEEIDKVISKK